MNNSSISAPSAGERAAKELIQHLDDEQLVYWSMNEYGPSGIDGARNKAIGIVAAALAACAREAKLEVLHRLPNHAWPDKTSYPQEWGAALANAVQDELWKAMEENRVALERAAGERAGDLRVKS